MSADIPSSMNGLPNQPLLRSSSLSFPPRPQVPGFSSNTLFGFNSGGSDDFLSRGSQVYPDLSSTGDFAMDYFPIGSRRQSAVDNIVVADHLFPQLRFLRTFEMYLYGRGLPDDTGYYKEYALNLPDNISPFCPPSKISEWMSLSHCHMRLDTTSSTGVTYLVFSPASDHASMVLALQFFSDSIERLCNHQILEVVNIPSAAPAKAVPPPSPFSLAEFPPLSGAAPGKAPGAPSGVNGLVHEEKNPPFSLSKLLPPSVGSWTSTVSAPKSSSATDILPGLFGSSGSLFKDTSVVDASEPDSLSLEWILKSSKQTPPKSLLEIHRCFEVPSEAIAMLLAANKKKLSEITSQTGTKIQVHQTKGFDSSKHLLEAKGSQEGLDMLMAVFRDVKQTTGKDIREIPLSQLKNFV